MPTASQTTSKKPQSARAWLAQITERASGFGWSIDLALEKLRAPSAAVLADPAVFRKGFMAVLGRALLDKDGEGLQALGKIAKKTPEALGPANEPLPVRALNALLLSGDWSGVSSWKELAARVGSAQTLAEWKNTYPSVVAALGKKNSRLVAEAAAQGLRAHAAPGQEEAAAVAGLRIVLRTALDPKVCDEASAKGWLDKTPKGEALGALLAEELAWASAALNPRAVGWLLKAGASVVSGSREKALEACAGASSANSEAALAVAQALLAKPIDWSRCHALGLALSRGSEKCANALLAAGAPSDGPATAPLQSGFHGFQRPAWEALRPEPLAGAALLMKGDAKKGLSWIKKLTKNGAQIAGCIPSDNAVACAVANYGEAVDAEPTLRAIDALGGLRPDAWRALAKSALAFRRKGYSAAAESMEGLVQELKARAERSLLAHEVASAKPRGAKKSAEKALGEAPALSVHARSRVRRI